jgi:hypothetical protein
MYSRDSIHFDLEVTIFRDGVPCGPVLGACIMRAMSKARARKSGLRCGEVGQGLTTAEVHLKRRYVFTKQVNAPSKKTGIFIVVAVRSWYLTYLGSFQVALRVSNARLAWVFVVVCKWSRLNVAWCEMCRTVRRAWWVGRSLWEYPIGRCMISRFNLIKQNAMPQLNTPPLHPASVHVWR